MHDTSSSATDASAVRGQFAKRRRTRPGAIAGAAGAAAAGAAFRWAARRRRVSDDPADEYLAQGFRPEEVATPSGRMTTYTAGDGPTVVFLHGIGGGASSWVWSRTAPAFVAEHRVVMADWVGWGASDHPRRPLLFDDYAGQFEALLKHVGAPAVVVAQSLAAGFAIAGARRVPDRVAGFALVAPSGGMDFGVDPFGPVARTVLSVPARLRGVNTALYRAVFHRRAFLRGWLVTQGYYEPGYLSDADVERWRHSATRPGAAYSALPFLSGDLRYDIAPLLADLNLPAAILWGSDERQVGRDVAARLAALRPDLPFIDIPRTRATPELEQPAATVAALTRAIAHVRSATDASAGHRAGVVLRGDDDAR